LLHLPGAPSVNHAESNFQRWLTLSVTWNIIMAAPFQGWGTGSFGYIFQRWMAGLPGGNPGRELMLHPHNEILYQWMEGGIAGLLGCILIIAGGISLIRQQSRSFIPASWVALLPVALHTQTEFPLYYSVPHILVVILLLVCVDTGKPLSVDLRRYRFSHLAGRAVILMLCAYFIALLAWSVKVGFILSRYESQVSGAKAEMKALTDAPWLYRSRYDYDKNTLLLADFNATHEPALLSLFLMENARWLRFRISPDASYNQILVLHYLRRDDEGRRLFVINQQLFPWDRRFGARKH
ncbi:PglL family O-oligosaccharyltransferase, partial [Citrobacter amalonaticus]|uniref:PglL family O-oligosaccharyltransferase n=1 Tax=Citrobacter amalonaticus TaxID=35703 RepID=UPI00300C7B52